LQPTTDTEKRIILNGTACSFNEGKSAASFCRQVAALVPEEFCNFYVVKIHKIANNSATSEAGEEISTNL
jgi:hypothetical protein